MDWIRNLIPYRGLTWLTSGRQQTTRPELRIVHRFYRFPPIISQMFENSVHEYYKTERQEKYKIKIIDNPSIAMKSMRIICPVLIAQALCLAIGWKNQILFKYK